MGSIPWIFLKEAKMDMLTALAIFVFMHRFSKNCCFPGLLYSASRALANARQTAKSSSASTIGTPKHRKNGVRWQELRKAFSPDAPTRHPIFGWCAAASGLEPLRRRARWLEAASARCASRKMNEAPPLLRAIRVGPNQGGGKIELFHVLGVFLIF